MAIRRSEVLFGLRGEEYHNVKKAEREGRLYYAFMDTPSSNVYLANLKRKRVCKVGDLVDDQETENADIKQI